MRKLSLTELNRQNLDEYRSASKIPIVVVLDNIRSAHNVGSFFRTVDGLGLERIILTGIAARPPHKEINKTAIGATNSVVWDYESDTLEAIIKLKTQGYIILGVEQTDKSTLLRNMPLDKTKKYAVVFGNEVEGISNELMSELDQAIEIEQFGTKHSFNVAVCGGMTLWELSRQLREK